MLGHDLNDLKKSKHVVYKVSMSYTEHIKSI